MRRMEVASVAGYIGEVRTVCSFVHWHLRTLVRWYVCVLARVCVGACCRLKHVCIDERGALKQTMPKTD